LFARQVHPVIYEAILNAAAVPPVETDH
jgi:hypothetical protein